MDMLGSPDRQGSKMRARIFLLFLLVAGLTSAQESLDARPEVLILTTGGTIASRTDAPLIAGPALVQAVPELLDYADIIQNDSCSLARAGEENQRHIL
jgi:L-asparaginase/Glu-tRNA(Gln) amidotransferase subunit D